MLLISIIAGIPEYASAEGLPVGKHLQDPAHKNGVISFYLNSVFTGIHLETNCSVWRTQKIGFRIIDGKTASYGLKSISVKK